MFTLFKSKSKKSGPLKALSSVFTSEEKDSDSGKMGGYHPHRPSSSSSNLAASKKNAPLHASKDDLSMTRKKDKNKVKANPYATIKMWRPISMTSSVSHDEDVYRSFTNFDVLVDEAKLPATGDLRNDDFFNPIAHAATGTVNSTIGSMHDGVSRKTSVTFANGDGVLSDSSYHDQSSLGREFSFRDSSPRAHSVLSSQPSNQSSVWSGSSYDRNGHLSEEASVATRRDSRKSRSSGNGEVSGPGGRAQAVVTEPLIPRAVTINEEEDGVMRAPPRRSRQMTRTPSNATSPPPPGNPGVSLHKGVNGVADIPADYPPSPSLNSLRSRSVSPGSVERSDSFERRGRTVSESSYAVVSRDVGSAVKDILSKTYGPEGFDAAALDVEDLLRQLKVTMDTLKVAQARVSSSSSQFQTVRQELQLQTKQFVQDAKCLVTSATGSRETISKHLHSAMHTLARLFLHSQATMVRMGSVHQAQHVGFEVLKVSASFKSTVAAANAAIGKPTTDPHMKYLMRQATNLAGLLSTLLKTLKNLDQN